MSGSCLDHTLEIEPYRYSATWLIGATTYAIDRFAADVERIFQPARTHVGGTINFHLDEITTDIGAIVAASRRRRILNAISRHELIDLGERIAFDARADNFFNWSHQVNFFLTLAVYARSLVQEEITVIIPGGMPGAASALYEQFGFGVLATDGPVRARYLGWQVSNREAVSSARPQLIADFMAEYDHSQAIFPSFDLPEKLFIARRGTRALSNESEIEELLKNRGFTMVFAEDFSVPQQFALLRQAEQVVAIHGAGLAPLEYRSPSKPGMRLIELAPPGIMTRWFGIMCEQIGGSYIAVRGRLKSEYIGSFYAPGPSEKFCNDSFEVDTASLNVALDMS